MQRKRSVTFLVIIKYFFFYSIIAFLYLPVSADDPGTKPITLGMDFGSNFEGYSYSLKLKSRLSANFSVAIENERGLISSFWANANFKNRFELNEMFIYYNVDEACTFLFFNTYGLGMGNVKSNTSISYQVGNIPGYYTGNTYIQGISFLWSMSIFEFNPGLKGTSGLSFGIKSHSIFADAPIVFNTINSAIPPSKTDTFTIYSGWDYVYFLYPEFYLNFHFNF